MEQENLSQYNVTMMYTDIKALQYVCPLIDSMSKDEIERFKNWVSLYCDQATKRCV